MLFVWWLGRWLGSYVEILCLFGETPDMSFVKLYSFVFTFVSNFEKFDDYDSMILFCTYLLNFYDSDIC
jgi:hypothetical protein